MLNFLSKTNNSIKKYKRGFAIRTWKIINLLSKTNDFTKNDEIA